MVSKAIFPFIVICGRNPSSNDIPHRVGINQNKGQGPFSMQKKKQNKTNTTLVMHTTRHHTPVQRLTQQMTKVTVQTTIVGRRGVQF